MRTYPILINKREGEGKGVAFLILGLIEKNCFQIVLSNLPDFKRAEKQLMGISIQKNSRAERNFKEDIIH